MIDQYRALYPHIGLAVYAYEPGGPVTVEVLTQDGSQFTRQAPTAQEALEALFGPLPAPIQEPIDSNGEDNESDDLGIFD